MRQLTLFSQRVVVEIQVHFTTLVWPNHIQGTAATARQEDCAGDLVVPEEPTHSWKHLDMEP